MFNKRPVNSITTFKSVTWKYFDVEMMITLQMLCLKNRGKRSLRKHKTLEDIFKTQGNQDRQTSSYSHDSRIFFVLVYLGFKKP